MKKIIQITLFFFCIITFAQEISGQESPFIITSINDTGNSLVLNKTDTLTKGGYLQIYLPSGRNFITIERKKSLITTKLIGQVTDVVATGATAVGLGSNSSKVLNGATKIINKAQAVSYGANALKKINELDISKKAKKIAGKQAKIESWKLTDEGYLLYVIINKKNYQIYIREALLFNEVKILKNEY